MAHIEVRKTAKGEPRYEVRWVPPGGRERSRTFTRRTDAEKFRIKVEHDALVGVAVDPAAGRLTVDELADLWLKSNPGKRSNTVGRDRSALKAHISPAMGGRRIDAVRQVDVQSLVNDLSSRLAPRTVKRTYGTLSAAFAYAVSSERISRSPCRNIKLPKSHMSARRSLGADNVEAIANAMDPRYAAMVWVAALGGLRWGEVAALRVRSVDSLTGRIAVTEGVSRNEHGRAVIGPPKSEAGIRTLAMPRSLIEVLARHMAAVGLDASRSDAFLFPDVTGGVLSYTNFRRRVWLPAVKKVGLLDVGFHDLRRANATAMVASGVDLKTAQSRLGHSDPRLTLAIYAHASTEADRKAADVLAAQFANTGRTTGGRGSHFRAGTSEAS